MKKLIQSLFSKKRDEEKIKILHKMKNQQLEREI